MFGFDEARDNYQEAQSDNKAELSHEVLAGAASFMAAKVFEDHQRKEGKQVSHSTAKELLAGLAGVEVDRLCEMNGADYIDRERAKKQARENSEQLYDSHYGGQESYDPSQQQPHPQLRDQFTGDNNW